MGSIDLTDIEVVKNHNFCCLYRLDNLYIGSKLEDQSQVELMKNLGVTTAIDMKEAGETDFPDEESLKKAGIEYVHFPVGDISNIAFEDLEKLSKAIKTGPGKKLLYCMSGNRVAAVLALQQALVLGHPKKRAFELAQKIGLTKNDLKEKLLKALNMTRNDSSVKIIL